MEPMLKKPGDPIRYLSRWRLRWLSKYSSPNVAKASHPASLKAQKRERMRICGSAKERLNSAMKAIQVLLLP